MDDMNQLLTKRWCIYIVESHGLYTDTLKIKKKQPESDNLRK